MKSLSEVLAILKQEKQRLKARYNVSAIAVFGSLSRGEATEASDIDLLVSFNQMSFQEPQVILSPNHWCAISWAISCLSNPIIKETVVCSIPPPQPNWA